MRNYYLLVKRFEDIFLWEVSNVENIPSRFGTKGWHGAIILRPYPVPKVQNYMSK